MHRQGALLAGELVVGAIGGYTAGGVDNVTNGRSFNDNALLNIAAGTVSVGAARGLSSALKPLNRMLNGILNKSPMFQRLASVGDSVNRWYGKLYDSAVRDTRSIFDGIRGGVTGINNPVPETLARVYPGNKLHPSLGPPNESEVFVTAANDIKGMSAKQITKALKITDSPEVVVIEFKSPAKGIATPINRSNPGFIGGGRTAGGAREFVIPNGPIPEDAAIRRVR